MCCDSRLLPTLAASMLAWAAAGCTPMGQVERAALETITPYKVEVVQGNFVSKDQIDQLRAGMSRQQVREILGTPLLTDVFHAQRWDYVFTIERQPLAPQRRRMTVFFDDDRFTRVEGDAMPSEQAFVAGLSKPRRSPRQVPLQASEEQLLAAQRGPANAPPSTRTAPDPAPTRYPPLEP
jgi:outer membrane protein assembly factor BamE